MDIEQKLSELEKIQEKIISNKITEEDKSILELLSKAKEAEVRYRVAEILVELPCEDSEKILLSLLDDEDYLVRINACDSLCFSESIQTLDRIKEKISDDECLVRGYAVLTTGDIAKNIGGDVIDKTISFLLDGLSVEEDMWIKINYYNSLILLGKQEYYDLLLDQINNDDYQIRCSVLNSIKELVTKDNAKKTKECLEDRLKKENEFSVSSSISNALQQIETL